MARKKTRKTESSERCRDCDCWDDLTSDGLCESCSTRKDHNAEIDDATAKLEAARHVFGRNRRAWKDALTEARECIENIINVYG